MQIISLFAVLAAAVGVFSQAPDPAINTPEGVTECLPVQLTFSGSAPPFVITVQPGGQAGAAPLVTVGTTSATSITWDVNLAAGTSCTLVIRDSEGRTNPSGTFTILPGQSTTCLTASASTAPATVGAATSSAAVVATTTSAGGAVVSTTASAAVVAPITSSSSSSSAAASVSASHSSSSTSSAAAAATSTKSGASALQQPLGIVGLLGLAGAAVLL